MECPVEEVGGCVVRFYAAALGGVDGEGDGLADFDFCYVCCVDGVGDGVADLDDFVDGEVIDGSGVALLTAHFYVEW